MEMQNTDYPKILSIVAGVMLLLAIPSIWAYAYFQILRWIVTIAAVLNAYHAHNTEKNGWAMVMGGVAILFNPIAPIFLSKELWVMLDVVTSILMFISVKKLANK